MLYKGYDIIYCDDDGYEGYYAQDFSHPNQPTSQLYESVDDVIEAIDKHEISFQ